MPTPPTNRWRNARSELIITALLLVLAIALGAFLFRKPAAVTPTPEPSVSPVIASPVATPELPSPSPSTAQITTLEIKHPTQTKRLSLAITKPITVADLMTRAAREQSLQIITKDYGGSLGLFFESIDGLKNDTATNQYWSLYINNTKSAVGASTAVVHPGDIVSWRYEKGT